MSEGGSITFTVRLSAASGRSHNLRYSTRNGSAIAGSDFVARSGTVTFSAGVTSRTLTVSTIEDSLYEVNELFYMDISNPSNGATISDSWGSGRIDNDETPPSFRHYKAMFAASPSSIRTSTTTRGAD